MIGNSIPINDANEKEWKKEIHDIRSAAFSFGAAKLYELENRFMQRTYEMTLQSLGKWPEEKTDDHDIRIAEALIDLSYSLINLGMYYEAENRVIEALELYAGVYSRGEKQSTGDCITRTSVNAES